ncbi:MAG: DUF1697 domain-containing protein [Sphingomonas sp.]|nr:DUF1697 domain-containing protein [Sphingomonas sp.]
MTSYVALLRAVNVGGRKLAMADLKAIAIEAGLDNVRTFIASGNLLFSSGRSEGSVARLLEAELGKHMGADVAVLVRTASELAGVVKANPFPDEPGAKVAAFFLEKAPAKDALGAVRGVEDERLALGQREIYVHFPNGMGRSKLKLKAQSEGTARNMNTVAKLAAMAKEFE